MEIRRFCDTLRKRGWTIQERDTPPCALPACVVRQYSRLPAEWLTFFNRISACANQDETAWFLCEDDFNRQEEDTFRWNEFELMSLQAAIDDKDAEWQRAIKAFWDNHFPFCLCVGGSYGYYAVRVSDGAVVHGAEPEFEEAREVAPSFAQFIEGIGNGKFYPSL